MTFPPFGSPQAIRDGVIEASINHEKGYVQSKEMIDIYSTREPQLAFHQRISFCLDIHNMSVKVRRPRFLMRLLSDMTLPLPEPRGSLASLADYLASSPSLKNL